MIIPLIDMRPKVYIWFKCEEILELSHYERLKEIFFKTELVNSLGTQNASRVSCNIWRVLQSDASWVSNNRHSLCFLKIHIEAVFRSDNLLSQQIHIHPKDAKILEHDVTEHHKRLFRVRVVFLYFKQGCH